MLQGCGRVDWLGRIELLCRCQRQKAGCGFCLQFCVEVVPKRNFGRRRKVQLLSAFFYLLKCLWLFEVVVDAERFAATTSLVLEAVSVSCVINFRLESVIIPRLFCSEVVVCAACTLTTTSML